MLNLWLHMQNPHYRSYRAGTRNMMLTFDSRPIYRALTYIAVPFLGPQLPRYIGLTLYARLLCKLGRPAHAYAPNHDHACALSQLAIFGTKISKLLADMQLPLTIWTPSKTTIQIVLVELYFNWIYLQHITWYKVLLTVPHFKPETNTRVPLCPAICILQKKRTLLPRKAAKPNGPNPQSASTVKSQ